MPDEPMTAPDPTAPAARPCPHGVVNDNGFTGCLHCEEAAGHYAPAARPGAGGGALTSEDRDVAFLLNLARLAKTRGWFEDAARLGGCAERLRALAAPPAPAPAGESPNWLGSRIADLAARDFTRVNDPRTLPPAPAPAGEAERDRLALEIAAEAAYTTGYLDGVDAAARHADDDYEHRRATAESRAIAYVDARPLLRTAPAPAPGAADARAREAWIMAGLDAFDHMRRTRGLMEALRLLAIETNGTPIREALERLAARRAAGEVGA